MKEDTIALAAQEALLRLGGRATAKDIYQKIVAENLYTFDTPTPEHVLDVQIKRHLSNSPRKDSVKPVLFKMNDDQSYELNDEPKSESKVNKKGPKRIMRSKDKSEIIDELMHDNIGVFREIWRLVLLAAQIGVKHGRREPLKSPDSGSSIRQDIFGNCNAWPGILYLISLHETEDATLLAGDSDGDNKRITLFEEYANGGLAVLSEYFKANPLNTDSLLTYIEVNTVAPSLSNRGEIDLTI
jgi:dnd system-associated protein 4